MIQMRQFALGSIFSLFLTCSANATNLPISQSEFDCVAKTVNGEASPNVMMQRGVIDVLINRVTSGTWGKTFCAVVYAKGQFNWKKHKQTYSGLKWERSVNTTTKVLTEYFSGTWTDSTNGATHFNTIPFKRHRTLKRVDNMYFSQPVSI